MHRGQSSGNYTNSLDDLDRELALLRQKRELLEGQQNRLRGGRGRGRGGGRGGGGGSHGGDGGHGRGGHPISPWDNNAAIRPLFNNTSDFNPQNSGGSGFNYSDLYDSSQREQFRQPPARRNDSRKRAESNNWSDRPSNNPVRQPPRKRSRPNPPAEQPRFQSEPRTPNNNEGPDFNRNSFRDRPNQNNRSPANRNFRTNKPAVEQPRGHDDILRANIDPHPKVRGRMEHALGIVLQNLKNNFPDKEVLFRDPLSCKTIKQMLRDRIKGLFLGKKVGQPNEIVLVYRESFPRDDDIIKSVDALISTTARKVASTFDKKVKTEETSRPAAQATAVAAKPNRSEPVTDPIQNSGPTAVKPSQNQPRLARPNPKRNPEAEVILGHFKENMHWAIDAELKLMFDNLKDLYKDQSPSEENVKEAIRKIVVIQRARFEEELNKPSVTVDKADDAKVEGSKGDASDDDNKTNETIKNETTDDKGVKTAKNGEVQAQNGEDTAEMSKDNAEKAVIQTENGQVDTEKAKEKEIEIKKTAAEIHKLCNYILGSWLFKHLPTILPKFRETVAKMVRISLFERVQEETGNKEVPIPAREAASTQVSDQRYYVSVVGRPKLPKRPKLSAFLWRFNPCSVKRHKSIFNLLFVGFNNKEDYDKILENSEVTFGTVQVFIKPSKARPTNEENSKLIKSAAKRDKNDVIMVEDRQGTHEPDQAEGRDDNPKVDENTDFTEDVTPDATKIDHVVKDTEVPIKKNEDDSKKIDENAEEEKDNFLDNMLDGAIVLDSVGADEDDLMFIENPGKDSQIKVNIDLEETVILSDDDNISQGPDKTVDRVQDETKAIIQDETKPADQGDEKKEDHAKQETPEDKGTGVTTRRSTRLNN